MTQTIITAGDASAGLVSSAGNDGTLVLQSGPAGSKVNAISIASDGTPTMLKAPKLDATAVVSMVRLNTANGYGSTNTKIRRFTNVVTNTGTDITYNEAASPGSSVTEGAKFTINTSGIYSISYSDNLAVANSQVGISLNTSQPTIAIASINITDVLACSQCYAVNAQAGAYWIGYLPSGSLIRAHTDGSATGATLALFTITKVA